MGHNTISQIRILYKMERIPIMKLLRIIVFGLIIITFFLMMLSWFTGNYLASAAVSVMIIILPFAINIINKK